MFVWIKRVTCFVRVGFWKLSYFVGPFECTHPQIWSLVTRDPLFGMLSANGIVCIEVLEDSEYPPDVALFVEFFCLFLMLWFLSNDQARPQTMFALCRCPVACATKAHPWVSCARTRGVGIRMPMERQDAVRREALPFPIVLLPCWQDCPSVWGTLCSAEVLRSWFRSMALVLARKRTQ